MVSDCRFDDGLVEDEIVQKSQMVRQGAQCKTLNMSMLKYFFEVASNKDLFDGLAINQDSELCERHMVRYPMTFLTFEEVDWMKFEDAYGTPLISKPA